MIQNSAQLEPSQAVVRRSSYCIIAAAIATVALAISQWFIFAYAPVEMTLGVVQKIFYVHLPLAWWGLFSFFLVFIASILFLIKKDPYWDIFARSAAEIGLLFCSLALAAGCIWAKASWGVWWTWDARLSTTLIMCFVYAGYLIVCNMDMPEGRRSRVAAVIGIIAFLDVPLVYFSARLWSYIHPKTITLEPEMKITLFICIAAFFFFWLALFLYRLQLACLQKMLDHITTQRMLRDN